MEPRAKQHATPRWYGRSPNHSPVPINPPPPPRLQLNHPQPFAPTETTNPDLSRDTAAARTLHAQALNLLDENKIEQAQAKLRAAIDAAIDADITPRRR